MSELLLELEALEPRKPLNDNQLKMVRLGMHNNAFDEYIWKNIKTYNIDVQ